MIEMLPKWVYPDSSPAFYDIESKTAIEGLGIIKDKMDELITNYNDFVEAYNKKISEFEYSSVEELRTFETAMRQEFQDFIDAIDIQLKRYEMAHPELQYEEETESLLEGGSVPR